MNKFIKPLILAFLFTLSFQVYSADCTNILEDKSSSVVIKDENLTTICDEDVAAQLLNIPFADAYNNDALIQAHYQVFGAPTPVTNKGDINMLSQLVTGVAMSINEVALKYALPIIVLITLYGIVKAGMGRDLSESIKDSKNWAAIGRLGLIGALVYPIDQFGAGQTFAIFAYLAGLKFATYLLSVIIGLLGFSTTLSENSVTAEQFKDDGLAYAANMTTLMVESKLTQATFNKANSPKVKAEFNDDTDDLSDLSSTSTDGSFEFFDGATNRSVTINDYVKNMLTQSSTELVFSDIYQFSYIYKYFMLEPNSTINARVISGQTVDHKANALATSTINSNLSSVGELREIDVDGELVESFLELDWYEDQIFDSVFFASMSADLATDDKDVIKDLVDSKLVNEFSTSTYTSLFEQNTIESLASKLVAKADAFVAKKSDLTDDEKIEAKKAYLNAAQAYLFGYYNYLSSSNQLSSKDGAVFAFNAFNTNAIPSSTSNQFINTLSYAHSAAQEYLRVRCSELMFDANESPRVYSQLRLMKTFKEDPSGNASSASVANTFNHSGQCMAYTGNSPVVLVDDKLVEKFYEADEALNKDNGKIRVQLSSIKSTFEDDIAAQKELLNKDIEAISNYYANMMAVSARAKHKVIVQDNAGEFSVLTDLRKAGAMAIAKYMVSIFTIVSNLSNSVKEASSSSAEYSTSVNKSTFALDFSKDKRIEKPAEAILQSQMNLGDGASLYFNLENDFTAFASAQQSQLEQERSMTEKLTAKIIDMVMPGTTTLKKGMGFDESKNLTDSLYECSIDSSACLNFTENPLVMVIKFGNDLINTAIGIYLVTTLMDTVSGLVDDLGDVVDSAIGAVGAKQGVLKTIAKTVAKVGKTLIKTIIVALKSITDLISPLVYLLLGAGITLFIVAMFAPLIGHVLAWINLVIETLLVFCFATFLLVASLFTYKKASLFPLPKLLGMYISIALRAPLLVLSFVIYYVTTYVALLALNTMTGGIIGSSTSSDIGEVIWAGTGITNVIMSILMLCIYMFLIYKVLMHVNQKTLELPDVALRKLNIDGFSLQTMTATEGMIGGGLMASGMSKVMGGLSEKAKAFGSKSKEARKMKAAGANEMKNDLQKKLKEQGYDIDLDALANKRGGK
ncbi:hypothetical protein EHJ37_19650 [Vibrio parahaemolyticus]|nr:hypothetical protein [Vibrio parahaemolyticus]